MGLLKYFIQRERAHQPWVLGANRSILRGFATWCHKEFTREYCVIEFFKKKKKTKPQQCFKSVCHCVLGVTWSCPQLQAAHRLRAAHTESCHLLQGLCQGKGAGPGLAEALDSAFLSHFQARDSFINSKRKGSNSAVLIPRRKWGEGSPGCSGSTSRLGFKGVSPAIPLPKPCKSKLSL